MRPWSRRHLLSALAAAWLAACAPQPHLTAPVRQAAAVAMPDSFSAEVASRVLADGGNAVDAAVAAGFSLAVTLPEAGNIGGGGFLLAWIDGQAGFLDYRETAPAAAARDMYLDGQGQVLAGRSLVGHRAVGVPGTVAGLWAAHRRHGRRSSPVLSPRNCLASTAEPGSPIILAGCAPASASTSRSSQRCSSASRAAAPRTSIAVRPPRCCWPKCSAAAD
jgi:gamma-glutamyltranspeptidase